MAGANSDHSTDDAPDPAARVRATLDAEGAEAAVEIGQTLLQNHYFDAALRAALADALTADGRTEAAKRLFPVPRAPRDPLRLRMTRQDDPGIENRVLAADGNGTGIPPIMRRDNARHFTLAAPQNLDDLPGTVRAHPEFAACDSAITLPGSRTLAYPNARYTANGVFITRDFEILNTNRVGHSGLVGAYFAPGLGWHVDEVEEPQDLGEPVFLFQRHPMMNYYHFIIEQACHLLTWKELYKPLGVRILLRRTRYHALARQMFALLGIADADVLETDATYVTAPVLVKPDVAMQDASRATFLTATTLDYFDFASAHHRPPDGGDTPKRIFISRRDVPKRGLTNEAELVAALEPFGFKEVVLTGMSLDEQIALFAGAEAVIGGHGAGLTNIGYCRPGTFVLEISKVFTLDRVRIFWEIAAARGLRFNIVVSDDTHKDHATSFSAPIYDITACLSGRLT